ncbi:MAG: ABC transporter ATP-binding protein [Eubacteriales bacterium]|nr:ABC transporter ATP-binding protein [Eubacteriales bacterium]
MTHTLELIDVGKKFGRNRVLQEISLSAQSGTILGFTGHNGSGKTVLFKCICGFMEVSEGQILIDKRPVGIEKNMPCCVAGTIEEPAFLEEYSGIQNLDFLYRLRHRKDTAKMRRMMELVHLDPDSRKKVGKYSLGMKQRLAIAQVLMEEQPILVMDEPMNGLDRQGSAEIRELLLEEKKKGKIVLLASHNKQDIDYLCDRVYELENGRMIHEKK